MVEKKNSVGKILWTMGIFAAIVAMTMALGPEIFGKISDKQQESAISVTNLPPMQASDNVYIGTAQKAFVAGSYQQAVDQYSSAISQGQPLSGTDKLYYAVALAKVEKSVMARQQLQEIITANQTEKTLALWYSAKIALSQNQKEDAKAFLQQYIGSGNQTHIEEAQKLMKKL